MRASRSTCFKSTGLRGRAILNRQNNSISSDRVSDCIWTKLAQRGEDLLDAGQRCYLNGERDTVKPTL